MDSRIGPDTRIEVVTEGVLTRMLQNDQALEGVGLVIFDEFHERNLHADLGLALCLQSQETLREDLRLLVMSATLDATAVAKLLDDAPILTSEGRSFPVQLNYRPIQIPYARNRRGFLAETARLVNEVVQREHGSVLVFLPGTGEIRQLQTLITASNNDDNIIVAPLYGQLDTSAQDRAIQPAPTGKRKLVLSTSIAETSLTIEGIRIVIDAGLQRLPVFDPNTGLSRLETRTVSQASANQRSGRAGRQQAGICYRLWPEHQHLLPDSPAEILQTDLTPLMLELALWGVRDITELQWLDEPPAAHVNQANELLKKLAAVDPTGGITEQGRSMAALGAHPRLAHMMLKGKALGFGALACQLAALLEEGDPIRTANERDSDMVLRLELLRDSPQADAARGSLRKIREAARRWQRQLQVAPPPADNHDLKMTGILLAFAYPDRIGQRRPGGNNRFLLSSGRGAVFRDAEPLAAEDMIVAVQLDGKQEAGIFLAAAIQPEQLMHYHAEQITSDRWVRWDERNQCVQARRQQRFGALVLSDEPWPEADTQAVQFAMLEGIRRNGCNCLPWSRKTRQLQARMNFLSRLSPTEWPDVSDQGLMATLEDWLLPYLDGITRLDQLGRLDLPSMLLSRLDWSQQKQLEELAPSHLRVPSGSRIALDYSQDTPVLAVRLQEMFGLSSTPRIAGGKVAVLLHLLSPARRPVQVTRDLGAFWTSSYHEVRKELRGRYPKHHWPEDPLQAHPTARTRPKHPRR
jgi:ATP-dependent helicase HrpB